MNKELVEVVLLCPLLMVLFIESELITLSLLLVDTEELIYPVHLLIPVLVMVVQWSLDKVYH
jgi:hypothetical protein